MFISLANCVDGPCGLKPKSEAKVEKYPSPIRLPDLSTNEDESEGEEVMNDEDFISFLRSNRLATLFEEEAGENKREAEEQGNKIAGTMTSSGMGTALLHTPRTICLSQKLDFTHEHVHSGEGYNAAAHGTPPNTARQQATPNTPEQQKVLDTLAKIEELRPNAFTVTKRGFMFSPKLPSLGTTLHFYNCCAPCKYMDTEGGCTAGNYCGLCHYCPVIHPKVPGEGMPNTQPAPPTSQSAIEFVTTLQEDRDELERLNDNVRNNTATNVGSKNHFSGECRPCVFLHKTGCKGGDECEHCHLCDESIYKMKKATQLKIGKYIRKLPKKINLTLSALLRTE